MTEQELQMELRRLTGDEGNHDPDDREREEISIPQELFAPTKADLYQLAYRHLEIFLELDFGANFLGALCENSHNSWNNYCRVSHFLGDDEKQSLLDFFDNKMERDCDCGDYWHAYKYHFPDRGFRPADLERVVRVARSMPEEQWGVVDDEAGFSADLRDALKLAIEEKACGKKTDWRTSGF